MNMEVLVASSDAENRCVLANILAQCDAKALIARNADEVRAILAKVSVDVVFCDETLPGGGFYYVLLLTKTIGAGVPLVLSSLLGGVNRYLEATELGVFDFIAPPFDTADVNSIIGRIRQNCLPQTMEGTRPPSDRRPHERMIRVAYDC
jgi:DNA-binding NtrC family response regulator